MEILNYNDINLAETIKRSEQDVNNVIGTVSDILLDVKENGDVGLNKYTEKFDCVKITQLQVSKEEIKEAYENLDDNLLEALKKAASNIEKFHKEQIPKKWEIEVTEGVKAGQIVRPINSVGCYIPGGRAAYPSSILMTVIPAKIAGVERIICCTPPGKDGKIMDAILVASDLAGADAIFKAGGAQAIAAMAYGTESVDKVEKIVGPGNIFVTAAKKLVFGECDIEFPAGPSEVLILADETANPEFIATDILAQAEHDSNASCFLATPSEELAIKTVEFVKELTEIAPRREIIEESLAKAGKVIVTNNLEEAIYVTNEYAPEHLIILTEDN
ncbi:MAG: histidinol dehydrogenase, partial [archaeon]|nr:histidinol dehydrogenase [archaeon]